MLAWVGWYDRKLSRLQLLFWHGLWHKPAISHYILDSFYVELIQMLLHGTRMGTFMWYWHWMLFSWYGASDFMWLCFAYFYMAPTYDTTTHNPLREIPLG